MSASYRANRRTAQRGAESSGNEGIVQKVRALIRELSKTQNVKQQHEQQQFVIVFFHRVGCDSEGSGRPEPGRGTVLQDLLNRRSVCNRRSVLNGWGVQDGKAEGAPHPDHHTDVGPTAGPGHYGQHPGDRPQQHCLCGSADIIPGPHCLTSLSTELAIIVTTGRSDVRVISLWNR